MGGRRKWGDVNVHVTNVRTKGNEMGVNVAAWGQGNGVVVNVTSVGTE